MEFFPQTSILLSCFVRNDLSKLHEGLKNARFWQLSLPRLSSFFPGVPKNGGLRFMQVQH